MSRCDCVASHKERMLNMEKKAKGFVWKTFPLAISGFAMAMMNNPVHAMEAPNTNICRHMIDSAAKQEADTGYRCISYPNQKVVIATLPPSATKFSQAAWASVKGFVRATDAKHQEGWKLIFEVSKGACMGMAELDALTLALRYVKVPRGLDSTGFTDAALEKLKPVDCKVKLFTQSALPKEGGELCDALESASKPEGGLAAGGASCRQVGDIAHIELKSSDDFMESPKPYFSIMAAAGRSWKSSKSKAILSIALNAHSNPSKCMRIPFESFDAVNKVDAQGKSFVRDLEEKKLVDLNPTRLGMAFIAPILKIELDQTSPWRCLGHERIDNPFVLVLEQGRGKFESLQRR